MRALPLLALAVFWAGNTACDPDNCADLPASFHLDVEFEDREEALDVAALRVDIETPTDRYRRIFQVQDNLSDSKTSIGVELDPAPTEEVRLTVTVAAYTTTSTHGVPAAENTDSFELDPNGCNRYRFELEFTE